MGTVSKIVSRIKSNPANKKNQFIKRHEGGERKAHFDLQQASHLINSQL